MTTTQLTQLKSLKNYWNTNEYFELSDIIGDISEDSAKEFNSADEVIEYLEEMINEQEVIYCSSAMDFLSKHDSSLGWAFELASELCFETKNLNSEILATLVLQAMLRDALEELRDKIEEIFEEQEE